MADDPTRSAPPAVEATRSAPTDPDGTLSRPSADEPTPAGGVTLPGYTVLGELGRGGMGVVYRARHDRLKREVAVKMILAGGHAGSAGRARFRREAEAIAALNHPHIVQIFETGEADGLPFLVLEHVPGGTLADLTKAGPVPPRPAAELVAAVAAAVHAAHSAGLVHRDLKPSNILLAADGTPKVADFGLAKWFDSDTGPTASGAVLGTPAYMAPEQCRGDGGAVGPPADVYALGGILYHLLTARPPFAAPTPLATLRCVLDDSPVPPRRVNPAVPPDLEAVCLTCLAKDPARRYPTAAAVADELKRFAAGERITARRPAAASRKWAWAVGLAVGVAVAAGLIAFALAASPRPAFPTAPTPPAPSPPPSPPDDDTPDQIAPAALDRVKRAVVRVQTVRPGGSKSHATGFVMSEGGVVATCAHVLGMTDPAAPPPTRVEVVIDSGTTEQSTRVARVLSVERAADLAFLQVPVAGLPPSLPLRPARAIRELQTLYPFGFPGVPGVGEAALSVYQSQVTSVQMNATGYPVSIRLTGGIAVPGMSGAPVVDAAGRVVGMIRGVMADRATTLLVSVDLLTYLSTERPRALTPGQAVANGGRITQPVTLRMADPMNRLAGVKLEVWTGNGGPTGFRPAAESVTEPGDSEPKTFPLRPRADDPAQPGEDRDFVGEIELPALPADCVYWVRPVLAAGGRERRAEAVVLRGGTRPVEANGADLRVSLKADARWAVELTSDIRSLDEAADAASGSDTHLRAALTEAVQSVDAKAGVSKVRYGYQKFETVVVVSADKRLTSDLPKELMDALRSLTPTAAVGRDGSFRPDPLELTPEAAKPRNFITAAHDTQMTQVADLTLPRPDKGVRAGGEWEADAVLRADQLPVQLPADVKHSAVKQESVKYRLAYRLVGTRERDGRTEAVVEIRSLPHEAVRVRGAALIDLSNGTVRLAELVTEFSGVAGTTADGKPVRASGRETQALRRKPGATLPKGAWEFDLLPGRPIEFAPVGRR